jgi:hypothetical protein
VVSVDENVPGGRGIGRRMRTALVQGVRSVVRDAYRITLDDGRSVICTGLHPWLTRKCATDAKWRSLESSKRIKVGTKIRWVTKPWGDADVEDGWFGGLLDGEGSLATRARCGGMVNITQCDGAVLDRAEAYLKQRGYAYRKERDERMPGMTSKFGARPVTRLVVSRMNEMFRLMGQTRPVRFLSRRWWEDKELPGKRRGGMAWATVTKIEPLGRRVMIDLQTSTGTYIAEGLVSHNTTFVCLYMLDECLFNSNVEAGVIAHTKEAATEIFRRKIQYPFEHLPAGLRKILAPNTESKTKLTFANGSTISVGTTFMSGTLQYLLISELGNTARKFPEKAREILRAALETVGKGDTIVFVESTGEGRGGIYFDLCETARRNQLMGAKLSRMDFRFHFFPWFECPDYVEMFPVGITKEMQAYFDGVEKATGVKLSIAQKQWYVKKREVLGEDILSQYPSTPQEAFEAGNKGAYFSGQFERIRLEKRICSVPHTEGVCVDTWWDLGMDDTTVIWFTQDVGREIHVIDYYEANGYGLEHYRDVLATLTRERRYQYGRICAPHDIEVRELGTGKSRLETARALGMNMETVPRVESKMDAIQKARSILSICWFDAERCDTGIDHLEAYRKQWDAINGVWKDAPMHDKASNGADAFQTFAMGHDFHRAMTGVRRIQARPVQVVSARGWT